MSTTTTPWVLHKFGGTSVADAGRYRAVAELLRREPGARKAVVVSAMARVTDALIELTDLARRQDARYRDKLAELTERHVATARDLLPDDAQFAPLRAVLEADARDLADILRAVWLARGASEQMVELVAGYGEVWSAQMLAAYVGSTGRATRWLDARQVLTVRPAELGPVIDWDDSRSRVSAWLREADLAASAWLVITGYVARTPDGAPTTLKRNGSDFSASIFGALLDAESVTIWTDVDGVLSADPRRVPDAVVLDELSYDEAMELAYFGAKVLHPRTMAPAVARGIPIWTRNTFNPGHPGTVIRRPVAAASAREGAVGGGTDPSRAVKGISTVDGVALVNVEGTGMMGVPGVAQRIFTALREVGVSVVLISQASSEHSVCFAVPEAQGPTARDAVERAFSEQVHQGQIQRVELLDGCSVLAAVGDGMARAPGVSARLFGALGRAGINVRAIAQGSSERNISVVIDRAESTRALRAVHAGFYLSDQTLALGVIGPGLVGAALLEQLAAHSAALHRSHRIDLRVRAITDSRRMLLGEPSVPLADWRARLEREGVPLDLDAFTAHLRAAHLPHAAVIDCTASDAIADRYAAWHAQGVHVVTPNKRAGAGPLARYRAVREQGRASRAHFLYEATVGAGLPVLGTLRDLIQTGDRVVRVEGVLSGTLSYVFNTYTGEQPFSAVVRRAKELGYTEPDPREDLSGVDAARKLVILGREMGLPMELANVAIESLVPAPLRDAPSAEAFLAGLADFDAQMHARLTEARARGEVLRYVGVIDAEGTAATALRAYPASHPFARIGGSDNIFAFTSDRYHSGQPLIVQGPGAGPAVTAAGVFADLLRLAGYVGA